MQFINHSQLERISNEYLINNIDKIFTLTMVEPDKTKYSLYLMSDNTFSYIKFLYREGNSKVIDEDSSYSFNLSYHGYEIANGGVEKGIYSWHDDKLELTVNDNTVLQLHKLDDDGDILSSSHDATNWLKLSEEVEVYTENLLLYTECWNRLKFNENKKKMHLVNSGIWGEGTISVNFSTNSVFVNNENA